MSDRRSRYQRVSRRAFLRGGVGVGAAALVPGLACGNSDEAVLAGNSVSVPTPTADADPTPTAGSQAEPTTAAGPEQPDADSTPDDAPDAEADSTPDGAQTDEAATSESGGSALPVGAEMVIAFTYQQAAGGKDVPPYVAVWIEDADGELVQTVALWFEQSGKGSRWLPDLKRWFSVDQARVDAGGDDVVDVVSSATRLAGSYQVTWDGSQLAATTPAPAAQYHVCIEAARERGPYSLVRQAVTLDGGPVAVALPDDGELVQCSVAIDA